MFHVKHEHVFWIQGGGSGVRSVSRPMPGPGVIHVKQRHHEQALCPWRAKSTSVALSVWTLDPGRWTLL